MSAKQSNKLIAWLEENYPGVNLTLTEVKELLEIERTAEAGIYGPWAENLSQGMIDDMVQDLKDSGEYHLLERKVELFKASFESRKNSISSKN